MKEAVKKIKILAIVFSLLIIAFPVSAREYVFDWYIKDFETEIVINQDSSILVTEKITADCGNLSDKHGIFRILPEKTRSSDGKARKTPVELVSITDFNDNPHKYETISSNFENTVTWKIGDPNKTVRGENYYEIKYKVYNAVYDDVFHWNLLGNFWKLEVDNFTAKVVFPEEITKDDVNFEYYTGFLGQEKKDAIYQWVDDNTLQIKSTLPLMAREGITIKANLPEGYFTPHEFGFFELYYFYFYFLIPFFVIIYCFYLWYLYGKDYRSKKPVLNEFLRPKEMDVLEAGAFMTNGKIKPRFITALIIDMAVKGALVIKEEEKKVFFSSYTQTVLKKIEKKESLTELEKIIFDGIFQKGDEVDINSLSSIFAIEMKAIKEKVKESLVEKNLYHEKGFDLQKKMTIASTLFFVAAFISITIFFEEFLLFSFLIGAVVLLIFAALMPKRTEESIDLYLYLKGLKRYMSVAEKDRQAFYEEENIFEKLLPYAIIFGITKKWAKKMEIIYGKDFFKKYSPVWWQGGSFAQGNFDSFAKSLNSLSSDISASHSSSSSGGSGSGGGGGGGGGGGW